MDDIIPCHVRGVHCDGCGTRMHGEYYDHIKTNVGIYYVCSATCKRKVAPGWAHLLRMTVSVSFLLGILLIGLFNA